MNLLRPELDEQCRNKPVQWLYLGDNKSMTVGEKRNLLLSLAKGDWVTFVDDDDMISEVFVETILANLDDSKKVLNYLGTQNTNGKRDIPFRHDRKYPANYKQTINGKRWKCMIPNHLCVWRADVARLEKFQHKNVSEDHDWAKRMVFHYTDEDQIFVNEYLYHYEYSKEDSETRGLL